MLTNQCWDVNEWTNQIEENSCAPNIVKRSPKIYPLQQAEIGGGNLTIFSSNLVHLFEDILY